MRFPFPADDANLMSIKLSFTPNLARHLECPDAMVASNTLGEALED